MSSYTTETLELAVSVRILDSPEASYNDVLRSVYDDESSTLTTLQVKQFRKFYIKHQKRIVQKNGKNYIAKFVKRNDAVLIDYFESCIQDNALHRFFKNENADSEAVNIEFRIGHLRKFENVKPIYELFSRHFAAQVKAFIKDSETDWRKTLKNWLQSDAIDFETWKKHAQWFKSGAKLSDFLKLMPQQNSKTNQTLKISEFKQHEKMITMLAQIFIEPKITLNPGEILVEGKTIFLETKLVNKIQKLLASENIREIKIKASRSCILCMDLNFPETNLVISTEKLRLAGKCAIILSGNEYQSHRKAQNATNPLENGANGADGRQGRPSGNLTIFSDRMVQPNLLTVVLNGGTGENGEDGGDGYIGKDGKMVTADEITKLFPHYSNPHFEYDTFQNYHPGDDWKIQINSCHEGYKYIYKTFIDSFQRKLYYNFAKLPDQEIYHAFILIIGGPGEQGTLGGKNGIGGEGGCHGKYQIINPETKKKYNIKVICRNGKYGNDGKPGKPGSNGKKGNDRAIADASNYGKVCIGDDEHTLVMEKHSMSLDYCFFGDMYYQKNDPLAFIEFVLEPRCQRTILNFTPQCTRNTVVMPSKTTEKLVTTNMDPQPPRIPIERPDDEKSGPEKILEETQNFRDAMECTYNMDVEAQKFDEKLNLQNIKTDVELPQTQRPLQIPICHPDDEKCVPKQKLKRTSSFKDAMETFLKCNVQVETESGVEGYKTYREFIAAQNFVLQDETSEEIKTLINAEPIATETIAQSLAACFELEFQRMVIERVECYMAITRYDSLITFLTIRCKTQSGMTLLFLQFILNTFTHLYNNYQANLDFLLTILAAKDTLEFVNVMLFARLCYRYGRRISIDTNIWDGICLIHKTRLKIDLGVKLSNHKEALSIATLYKVILMLQNDVRGAKQLRDFTLEKWIEIAEKGNWSEMSLVVKEFGTAGYYLGVLNGKGFKKAEILFSELLRNVKYVPEIHLARMVLAICLLEVEEKNYEKYIKKFESVLKKGNNWKCQNLKLADKHATLITSEAMQKEFREFVGIPLDFYLPGCNNSREIDDLERLVVGQHDKTDEEKRKRRKTARKFCGYLKQMEQNVASTRACQLLIEFDKHLYELCGKKLRITQKMAVLCAVESEKHVLEQVNTGEGKSLIIAAIAVIRCKRDKQKVDIITSSPVLAQRDAEAMKPLFEKFKLTVGHNCSENIETRRIEYTKNIVYGDIHNFQRDFLLQNFLGNTTMGSRTRDVVIADEVDNMLLDNGNNILYMSHEVPGLDILNSLLIYIFEKVHEPVFNGQNNNGERMQSEFETDTIVANMLEHIYGRFSLEDMNQCVCDNEKHMANDVHDFLIRKNVIDADGYLLITSKPKIEKLGLKLAKKFNQQVAQKVVTVLTITVERKCELALPTYLRPYVKRKIRVFVKNCKNSMNYEEDDQYVIDIKNKNPDSETEPQVIIVDKNTGADHASSTWSDALHQFLELAHGCRISPLSMKAVFVSNVVYINGYKILNGLSGTLGSDQESKTLIELYGVDVIRIPTFQPRLFYEHAPILAKDEAKWSKCIYDKINDQISAGRSLLIICNSISDAKMLQTKITKLYSEEQNPSLVQKNCFENVAMYTRSRHEFEFENEKEFDPGRVIIATNLAGRGTDIKLSKQLIKNRGLHVITAFIPKNARIEEQAFGRAARSGQPGSAQIIARIQGKQSIFQFKTSRDNDEAHRLSELKLHFKYHTEIEEGCLKKFSSHYANVLCEIHSAKTAGNEMRTPEQIVYFAVLDKWAMWLEEREDLIEKCKKMNTEKKRDRAKDDIIQSVDKFLSHHTLNVEEAPKTWLDFPQSLIALGLHEATKNKDFKKAFELFDQVIDNDLQFAAEAYYYKACFSMKSKNNKEGDHINVALAEKYFHISRTLFANRLSACIKECSFITQFVTDLNKKCTKSKGFEKQQTAIADNITTVINNIDWIIGIPCTEDMFVNQNIDQATSASLYDIFSTIRFVIAPSVYINHKPEPLLLRNLHDAYGMSNKDITQAFAEIKRNTLTYFRDPEKSENKDSQRDLHEDESNAFRCAVRHDLEERIHLSNSQAFFTELHENGVIKTKMHLKYADPNHETEVENAIKASDIQSVALPDKGHFLTINNSVREGRLYYNVSAIENLNVPDLQNKMLDEFIGEICQDTLQNKFAYFTKFDGVTVTELADYFEISLAGAAWILQTMEEHDILDHQKIQKTRITTNNQLWEEKVEKYLSDQDKMNPNDKYYNKIHYERLSNLRRLRTVKDLQHLSASLLKQECEIQNEEELRELYQWLQNEKIIEDYDQDIYRLNNRLDFSHLPKSIADSVDFFLSNKFAYSFGIERLTIDMDAATDDAENRAIFHQIHLPKYPYTEFFNDLETCGFVISPRIVTNEFENLDNDCYDNFEDIQSTLCNYASKLLHETEYHLDFNFTEQFIADQNLPVNAEIKHVLNRGLKLVMGVSTEKNEMWSGFANVINVASTIFNRIKKVGCWLFQVASDIGNWISDHTIKPLSKLAAKLCIGTKEKLEKYITAFTSSELFQGVSKCVKTIGKFVCPIISTIGDISIKCVNGIVENAKMIGNKAKNLAVEIGQKATELYQDAKNIVTSLAEGIYNSQIVQMAINTAVEAINVAKYAYRKMSALVKAARETYEYYNQCRVHARKIAQHDGLGIDEYTILRTYVEAGDMAGEEEPSDDVFKKRLAKHLASMHEKAFSDLRQQIESHLRLEFANYYQVEENEIDEKLVQAFLSGTLSVSSFKKELEEQYASESQKVRIVFTHLMEQYAYYEAPLDGMQMPDLEVNFSFDSLEGITRTIAMDYATEVKMAENDAPKIKPSKKHRENADKLTEMMASLLCQQISGTSCNIFVKTTAKHLENFLVELRKPDNASEFKEFDEEDKKMKKTITAYETEADVKKKNSSMLLEFYRTMHDAIGSNNSDALKAAIKHGIPLPISALKEILPAVSKILGKKLAIRTNDNTVYGSIPATLKKMSDVLGCIFTTNGDYLKSKQAGIYAEENGIDACLYELIAGVKGSNKIPSPEAFRQLLIDAL